MPTKKPRRRKDAPFVPPRKRRPSGPSILSARAREILARSTASRAELDARAAGADLSGLRGLEAVFYPTGRAPRPPGLHRLGAVDEEEETVAVAPAVVRPPIAPPVAIEEIEIAPPIDVAFKNHRCSVCG